MAKIIKPLDCEQFAEVLCNMKDGETIEFATNPGSYQYDEPSNKFDCECWYFARKIYIPEYCSRFVLIDYCGGEEAFAIPFNCYKGPCDEDDRDIVPDYVKKFFEECRGEIIKYAYAEMEEE